MKSPLHALALALFLGLAGPTHAAEGDAPKKESAAPATQKQDAAGRRDGRRGAGDEAPKREPSAAQKAQREKMKTCNQDAKEKALKGEERKAFMRQCLSSKPKDGSQ
ncbi:MAG: PsiF family protein [Zoogloeaceae bacterium]|jgi:hypothetical protein|nr:PsiF family protein [Zoogloeaceae bacterium]